MVNKREKESDRDTSESKKHRKANFSNSTEVPAKIAKPDIYAVWIDCIEICWHNLDPLAGFTNSFDHFDFQNIIQFEEEESKKRSADKDAELFIQTCDKLKTLFAEIAQLKTQSSSKAQDEIKEKRVTGSFLFALLKKLSRLDKVRLRAGRDALHKEKLMVDSNKLQLQNLLYEADHLRKEVQHCLQFKSQDEDIDLVDEEKFYKEAPDTISRPEKTQSDEHARRLARLEWELHQRKELASMCKTLQNAKESVAREIESKTNQLQSLMPNLEVLQKATRPLQEALEINLEREWAIQDTARLLPRPLYVAYANLSAYSEISKKLIDVQIVGDEEEAKELDNTDKIDNKAEKDGDESGYCQFLSYACGCWVEQCIECDVCFEFQTMQAMTMTKQKM